MTDTSARLPREVVPIRYDLRLEPDLPAAAFTGTVRIACDVVAATPTVTLHACDLEVDGVLVDGVEALGVAADPAAETVTVTPHEPLEPGPHALELTFRGVLNDKLVGFYRSSFTAADGREHLLACTQMESVHARRAFPCFDEPDRKAVFGVTLVVPEDLAAIGNGRVIGEAPLPGGRREVRFADTPVMSTYLLAFVVGPFEATDPVDVDGVPLRVWTPPGQLHLTAFALDIGAFALRWFREYYDLPYFGDKIDMIAIPDFAFGAMENLGAITYRETALLVDPATATQAELMRVATVVAHELAHMWFGDLVTMKWWNGIWLNEAFATFMELASVDAWKPEWHRWDDFGLERSAAFDVDSLESTRPVEYEVRTPADAEGMFDLLTYQKGGSVLRMLEQLIGPDRFRDGVRRYLAAHQLGNTETSDLFDALDAAAPDVPVRTMMDGWIFRGGHPVVSLTRDDAGVIITQRRSRYATAADPGEHLDAAARAADPTWIVPVALRTADGTEHRVLLDGPSTHVALPAGAAVLTGNSGASGFYRVQYDDATRAAIAPLATTQLAPAERAMLVDDTFAAVLGGDLPAMAFLELVSHFEAERDPAVWGTIVGALSEIELLVSGLALAELRRRVQALVAPGLDELGWEPAPGDDELRRRCRGRLVDAMGTLGKHPETVELAHHLLRQGDGTDPDVAAAAVRVVAANGSPAEYEEMLARSRAAATPQERIRYLGALADFPDTELGARTVQLVTTPDVRGQDAHIVLGRVLLNPTAGAAAWHEIERQWDVLTTKLPDIAVPRFLGGIRALSRPDVAARVETFLDAHPVAHGERLVAQHRERLRVGVALRAREAERLDRALAESASRDA